MLAGARNVAFGATIVMAGLFAVMLAERAWVVLIQIVVSLPPPDDPFGLFDVPDPWSSIEALASGYTQSLIGASLMIWLVGPLARPGPKSMTAGPALLLL